MQTQEELQGKCNKRKRAHSPSTSTTTNNSIDSATTTIESVEEEQDMVNCLILLAQGTHHLVPDQNINHKTSSTTTSNPRIFQCKTCNKCFPSFQSLGGHRTSHRNPKHYTTHDAEPLTTTTTTTTTTSSVRDNDLDLTTTTTLSLKTPTRVNNFTSTTTRVHRCSICYAEFSSGQALGGHMRRHRNLLNASSMISGDREEYHGPKKPLNLDLNLPAPEEDQPQSKFSFQRRENVIVFSSSLVNCNY